VPSKSYYQLLDLPPAASSDIKKAFRQQIARYHPDKVQHPEKNFGHGTIAPPS
jgi:DnaJ-class molecular chaperone